MVGAISPSVGPDWEAARIYAAQLQALKKVEAPDKAELRVPEPSDDSNTGLEGYLLGGGVLDESGELSIGLSQTAKIHNFNQTLSDALDIYEEVLGGSKKSKILSYSFIQELFPAIVNSFWGGSSSGNLLDNLFGKNDVNEGLVGILNSINELNKGLADFKSSLKNGSLSDEDYSVYFELNNPELDRLADKIVEKYGAKTDDEKFYAIEQWIQDNLTYVSDLKNWGVNEYWPTASQVVDRMKEDCDGGSILMTSLMHHAGIPDEKNRWYGGVVRAGTGAETGGHAWVAYRRNDGEWVIGEWCYLPNDIPVEERTPMKNSRNYLYNFFTFHPNGATVNAGGVNGVRDPEALDKWDKYKVIHVAGQSIPLGEFMGDENELYLSRELMENGHLDNGYGTTMVDENGRKMKMVISKFSDAAQAKRVLDSMQAQYNEKSGENYAPISDGGKSLIAKTLYEAALRKR